VAAAWTALLLENALGHKSPISRPRPVSAVIGSIEGGRPNAAALGPLLSGGTVLVIGSLAALPEAELRVTLAHELGHLRLRHTIALSFALAAIAAGLPLLVRRLVPDHAHTATVVSVLGAAVVLSATQRFFEAAADDYSVSTTGDPGSLANALEALEAARAAAQAAASGPRARLRNALTARLAGRALLRLDRILDENIFGSHPGTIGRIKGLRRRATGA
jgi:Zn-dependent protease with chaperone function